MSGKGEEGGGRAGGERTDGGGRRGGGTGEEGRGGVRDPSNSSDDQLPRESSRALSKVKLFSALTVGVTTSSIKPLV